MSRINIQTGEKRFPTAPDLYGLFFEDISRAGDGGLYPEMLRNRSFEDSLIPEECTTDDNGKTFTSPTGWVDEFNGGEGMNEWVADQNNAPTDIPAWYAENASISLELTDTLNEHRKAALRAAFEPAGIVMNIGMAGVPQETGRSYQFFCFAKAEKPVKLVLSVKDNCTVYSSAEITVDSSDWKRFDAELTASGTTGTARLEIMAPDGGEVLFGFASLMPADTFMGHGLRKDLVEKLRDMHPAFLRFPGGCIVEGFTMETVMFFKKTIGPVWERPSFWLLWHYRTTNGLGFHEYLQLCEDLDIAPLYVCNCGMTCQGRKPHYFDDAEMAELTEDIMNALEYALGGPETKMGQIRSRMGHPAPFRLKYLEIGNENWGDIYAARYAVIRNAVLSKYPDIIILSNDRDPRLKADIIDEHYYNMPEFYAENIGIYDNYDRTKADIFVGEFSVNQTYEGQLRGAVAEAMFMVGFERNQDKVRLCSYAPLFEHLHFGSWYPNLIIFDNYRSYAIPSYYAFKLFSGSRGDQVVISSEETEKIYQPFSGRPIIVGGESMEYRNATFNGAPVSADRDLERGGVVLGAPETACGGSGSFEIEVKAGSDPLTLAVLVAPKPLSFYDRMQPVPTDPWKLFNLEAIRLVIGDGKARMLRGMLPERFRPAVLADAVDCTLPADEFVTIRCEYTEAQASYYLNGELLISAEMPNYPAMCSVTTDTEDEIFIKVVNFTEKSDDVEIALDCEVSGDYTVQRFYGAIDAENTINDPEHVCDETVSLTGAAKTFVYTAPAMSVNVLKLKKA